ncbi:MAG: tandem-95 repeat protein, partial [Asticcacaulis sp.]|nr:tandem-95 repeat protein [Asticcacaulis sp.]
MGGVTGNGTLINDLGGSAGYGEVEVPRNDDEFTSYNVGSVFENGLTIGGQTFSSIYVNTNGNITFGNGLDTFTPSGISAGNLSIIAPFWADVDTRSVSPNSGPIYVDMDSIGDVVTITWDGVDGYGLGTAQQNYFQLQLYDRGSGDFDIVFRYQDIQWTTGTASAGVAARAGYNLADNTNVFELSQSGDSTSMLDLEGSPGNTGQDGLWVFEVRNGTVVINDPPTTGTDTYTVGQGAVLTVGAQSGLLANDSDPQGTPLSASLASGPSHGSVSVNADGSFSYTPDAEYSGADSFTYLASDGTLGATETVSIMVNGRPAVSADTYTVDEDAVLTENAQNGVLANDSDPQGMPLSASLTSGPSHGSAVVNGDGSFSYTPDTDFSGADSFTYVVSNGGAQATATASITVNATPDAPLAEDDTDFSTGHNQAFHVSAGQLLANDTDADGDVISVVSVGNAQHGSVSLNGGDVVFTPDLDFSGLADFTYTVADSTGRTDDATVTVDVAGSSLRLDVAAGAALAPGDMGTAHVSLTDTTGGTLGPVMILVQGQGVLIQDPLTGQFSGSALLFSPGGSGATPNIAALPVVVRMAATSDTSARISGAIVDPDTTIDWAAQKSALQPSNISDSAWDRIFPAFTAAVGTTVGSLTAALAANAQLFADHGIGVSSATAALAFELEQAGDFGTIAAHEATGALGGGWASLADLALHVGTDGNTDLTGLVDFGRLASLSAASSALYTVSASVGTSVDLAGKMLSGVAQSGASFALDVEGHYGATDGSGLSLTSTATGYTVDDGAGDSLIFDATGALVSVHLADGQTLSVAHDTHGRITGFTSDTGATLTFTRTADGHVSSVGDSTGGAVAL